MQRPGIVMNTCNSNYTGGISRRIVILGPGKNVRPILKEKEERAGKEGRKGKEGKEERKRKKRKGERP
jgi:hypothetical protein